MIQVLSVMARRGSVANDVSGVDPGQGAVQWVCGWSPLRGAIIIMMTLEGVVGLR